VEFPGFSFVLGDMHPHVLALPFAFLSLALAFAWWLKPAPAAMSDEWSGGNLIERSGILLGQIGLPLYATSVVVLGGLSFLNTWDVLIHLFVFVSAYVLSRWRAAGSWQRAFLGEAALTAGLLVVPAVMLYLPFYLGFRSQAGPPFLLPMLMRPTRLAHFLIIFGMPLWAITVFVVAMALRRRRLPWLVGLQWAAFLIVGLTFLMLLLGVLIAVSAEGSARILSLAADLGVPLAPLQTPSIAGRITWAFAAVLSIAGPILRVRLATPWLVLFLGLLIAAVITLLASMLDRQGQAVGTDSSVQGAPDDGSDGSVLPRTALPASTVPFVLLLVLTATLLTLGPEFLYIRDNFGQRLNTVFKFYYQAWILFGVAALVALDYLWQRVQPAALVAGLGYGAMLAVALLFPYYGITSRAQEYALPPTLSGIAYLAGGQPDELAALTWLRQNVEGAPVIVEAVGGQYSPQGHGRVSASTGLPTPVGWAGHEYQWRGVTPVPAEREDAVQTIYTSDDWQATKALLDELDVSLIYVGPLEVSTYGPAAREKFDGRLEVAYANDSVTIYRWLPLIS
jgi:YYY domain-containing protein